MNINYKDPPRTSISDVILNIETLLSKNSKPLNITKSITFQDSHNEISSNQKKPKIKSVIKECENMLSSQNNLEKNSFGLNMTPNFFKRLPSPKHKQVEVSRPIMMLNQTNVSVSTKKIQQSIEELNHSKIRFERLKRNILENEGIIKTKLHSSKAIFDDFFILPLHYINTAHNRDQKLLSTLNSSLNDLYQETFFGVKSQNNFISAEYKYKQISSSNKKRKNEITKGRLFALKVFNSFLKTNNFLDVSNKPNTIKNPNNHMAKKLKASNCGFQQNLWYEEWYYSEEEEEVIKEEIPLEINNENLKEKIQEKAQLEMEEYAYQLKKKRIHDKLERNPKVLEVLFLFLKKVYFDAVMPFKFIQKKSITFDEYNFALQDNIKKFSRKNRKTIKKERNLDVRRLEEARENQLLSSYTLDFFDFSDYPAPKQLDLNVGPDEEKIETGIVTLAAPIYKQIKDTDKVHFRWLVLRGFNLYWYRSADHRAAKGIISLPTKPIQELMVNKRSMFKLQEGSGRNLTFELKDSGTVWRRLLANQIAFKYYYDIVDKEKMKISNNLVNFFEKEGSVKLDLSDSGFRKANANNENEEGKIVVFFDLLVDALVYHNKLRELNLAKAMIGPKILQKIMGGLAENAWNFRLEVLNLERNAMNFQALISLEKYLLSENSFELKILCLNYNDLYDQGIMHLSQTLFNRHRVMLEKKLDKYNLPLQKLGLLNVKMSDQGFFGLINYFEKIHKMNKNKGILEYSNHLDLNISENLISENSLKGLCIFLEEFNGFNVLEIGRCKKIKGYIFKNLLSVLKNNHSIYFLNYEENEIDTDGFQMLIDMLEENYVMRKIKFTIPYVLHENMLGIIRQAYQFYHVVE